MHYIKIPTISRVKNYLIEFNINTSHILPTFFYNYGYYNIITISSDYYNIIAAMGNFHYLITYIQYYIYPIANKRRGLLP